MNGMQSREQLEARLVAKAMKDPAFKRELLKNPRAAVAREFGAVLPDHVEFKVVEESRTVRYLVLPDLGHIPAAVELGESMLASATGGQMADAGFGGPNTEQCCVLTTGCCG